MKNISKLFEATEFSLSRSSLGRVDPASLMQSLSSISCKIEVGVRGWGDSFELPFIVVSASPCELKKLALGILWVTLGPVDELYLPGKQKGVTKAWRFSAARPPAYPDQGVASFKYSRSEKIKRYPWYPASLKWNAAIELPSFGLCGLPGKCVNLMSDGRLDLKKPHAVHISGYPRAMLRLARVILNYANMEDPIEEIDFEVEGGFRGLAPHSYDARLIRLE